MKYTRILLKLSGEALAGGKGRGFDEETCRSVARQVKAARDQGAQIAVVIGGGNFWRGRTCGEMDRIKADQIGMLATIMNSLYAAEVFRLEGMETVVYTAQPTPYTTTFDAAAAEKDLADGKIVFCGGGVGHPYFSTDMATALRAIELKCDAILMAKNIDAVYDCDPGKHPEAKRYDTLTYETLIGNKLGVIDLASAVLCMDNRMNIVLFKLEGDNITRAVNGEKLGTLITCK